jgi:hypothetical protein
MNSVLDRRNGAQLEHLTILATQGLFE